MKKISMFFITCLLFVGLCVGCGSKEENVVSDADLEQVAEPFVCVKEIRTNYAGDEMNSYGIRYAYDDEGKENLSFGCSIENGLETPDIFTRGYQYDDHGGVAALTDQGIGKDSTYSINTEIENRYDDEGFLVYSKSVTADTDGNQLYSEYSYDEKGRLCQEIKYDQLNDKQFAYSNAEDFEYDEYGNVIKQTIHFTVDPDSEYPGASYYDYSVIESEYLPLSEYLAQKSRDLKGSWYDMYNPNTICEISDDLIEYTDSTIDWNEYTYEIIDDVSLNLSPYGEESRAQPYLCYSENGADYLFIGGISSYYGNFILKKGVGGKNEPTIPDNASGEAAVVASEVIERYWRYETYGFCCDTKDLGSDEEFMATDTFAALTPEQQSEFRYLSEESGVTAMQSLCCNSIEESEVQARYYLSDSIIEGFYENSMKFEVNGILVFGYGYAVGIDEFDTNPRQIDIQSADGNTIVAVSNHYISSGEPMGKDTFRMTKENDHYVLTEVDCCTK